MLYHGVFTDLDLFHIDVNAAVNHNAKVVFPAHRVGGTSLATRVFFGSAADVDAGAAEELAINDGSFQSFNGQTLGEGRSGLSCAYNDCIKFLGLCLFPINVLSSAD